MAKATGTSGQTLVLRDESEAGPLVLADGEPGVLGRMLAYGLVVLALGGVALIVCKRYLPRLSAGPAGKRIRVLDSTYLGPRKQVHVLQVGSQRFLVASCRDSVTMLSELAGSFAEVYDRQTARDDEEDGGDGDGTGGRDGIRVTDDRPRAEVRP